MALAASNPTDRARQMIALSTRLGERLEAETVCLLAQRPQDIYEGIEETRNLSNLYRHESMRIKGDPSLLQGISAADKKALRQATELFQDRLHKYGLAVNAAKTITEGVISAVAEDLNARRKQSSLYGAKGRTLDTGPQSLNFGRKA
jgi:hypothetical protein